MLYCHYESQGSISPITTSSFSSCSFPSFHLIFLLCSLNLPSPSTIARPQKELPVFFSGSIEKQPLT